MRYLIFGMLLVFSCNHLTKRMNNYEVFGIDISHHQGHIEWDTVATRDVDFVFIKATEGTDMTDSLFLYNWRASKAAGIKRGAYHYFIPTISARKQAENFIGIVKIENGDLPPVMDFEHTGNLSRNDIQDSIRMWMTIVEKELEIKPLLYTNLKLYYKYIAASFDKYPVWIARYNYSPPNMISTNDWIFWQYGNKGRLKGIHGDVDFNVFNGTPEDLEAICFFNKEPITSLIEKQVIK